jgi:hypothetical protein
MSWRVIGRFTSFGPDGRTRIGPWLLLDSHNEVLAILRWENVYAKLLAEYKSSMRRWVYR